MVNLLILAGAMIAGFRMVSPLLRIAIKLLAKLVGFAFFIAAAILMVIAVLSHGAVI